MIRVDRWLSAVDERWAGLSSRSVWTAAALVLVAWGLIALNRLGGLAFSEPRAFARLAVVGVWGWLALTVAVWAAARVSVSRATSAAWAGSTASLLLLLSVVGWSHVPIVALALVVFVGAGALQILGPGLVVAFLVFAVVVPFALVTGVRQVAGSSTTRAVAIVAFPYVVWLLIVVRHALRSIQHLL